jgi:septation ring formation regulator EzrA
LTGLVFVGWQTSVASYNDKLDRLNGDDEARTSIVERLRTFDDQLEAIKAEEQEARDKLTALQQKEEKKYEDIPALKEVSAGIATRCGVHGS